jgi:hypothetical protein
MRSATFRFWVAMGLCVPAVYARPSETESLPADASLYRGRVTKAQSEHVPAPAPELRTLTKALAGRWTTREKYEPTGPTPKGGIGHGDLVWRPGPGGFTLLEEYHSKTPMGELFGFGLIWWDHAKGLQHMWCINVNPGGCEMFPPPPRPGPKWDGKQLVLDTEVDIAGTKYVWHEAISMTSATSFTQTVDIGENGGAMRRWLTSDAIRITSSAGSPAAVQPEPAAMPPDDGIGRHEVPGQVGSQRLVRSRDPDLGPSDLGLGPWDVGTLGPLRPRYFASCPRTAPAGNTELCTLT